MGAATMVREGISLWNAHDREAFIALYDDDATLVDQPTGRIMHGHEEIARGFYDMWTDGYPDNQLTELVVFGEGDLVCLQAHFTGTNTGVFRAGEIEMPPTGASIDAPFVYIAEVREGKVTRAWHYYDRLLAFEQEGVLSLEKLFSTLPAPA